MTSQPTAPDGDAPSSPSQQPASPPPPPSLSGLSPADLAGQDFFALAGLSDLPDAEREALLKQLLELIRDRVLLRLSTSLSAQDRAALNELLTSEGNDSAIKALLERNGLDIGQITTEEALAVKLEFSQSAASSASHASTKDPHG